MDRREAIQKIEAIIDNGQDYGYWTDAQRKALDLAIEALSDMSEEEVDYCNNCPYISWGDDCISRKDAIEEIAIHDCTNGKVPNFTGREVQLILNNLPPATPTERTGEWIPVSERLPEYTVDMWDEGVIATVNGREGNIIYENGIVPDAWFEDGKWYVNDVELENAKVVAWQPLPEPYKEGDSE